VLDAPLSRTSDPVKTERAKELRRRMTRAERMLWHQLRRQQPIAGFIADFYCHAARLIIEVDGGIHRRQGAYDADRDRVLSARGLRILRFTNDQIERDLPAVLTRIAAAVASPPASSPQPPQSPAASPSFLGGKESRA
jgi:very-short-patch-repair endonuclease